MLATRGTAGWVESAPDRRGGHVVSLGGAADAASVTAFNRMVASVAEQGLPLVIDLSDAGSLHPVMAGAIAGWVEHGRSRGPAVLIVVPQEAPDELRDQLELAAEGLTIWPSVPAALAGARPR